MHANSKGILKLVVAELAKGGGPRPTRKLAADLGLTARRLMGAITHSPWRQDFIRQELVCESCGVASEYVALSEEGWARAERAGVVELSDIPRAGAMLP